MRRIFHIDNFLVTALVFLVLGAFYYILPNFGFLDPLSTALSDFEITDLVFSKFRDDASITPDTNIVIVNISELPRNKIAEELDIISANKPAVIGIDAFFRKEKTIEIDTQLVNALARAKNVVMVSKLSKLNKAKGSFDSLELSNPKFLTNAHTGFANLVIDLEAAFMTARSFSPHESVGDTTELAFPVKIAQIYKPECVERLLKRGNDIEIINYRGNFTKFYVLDADQVLGQKSDLRFLREKIVLMGYLGTNVSTPSLEDIFFTPLNARYAGKTYPDMYGVMVHANILSMTLKGEFINDMPDWMSNAIAVILCFVSVAFFSYIDDKHERWFDTVIVLTQFFFSVAMLVATVMIFAVFRYKADFTLAIIAVAFGGAIIEVYDSIVKEFIEHFIAVLQKKKAKKALTALADTEKEADPY